MPADDVPPLSGFTLVKNATVREYPVEAVLRTLARACDEVVVNVGASEDDTLERIRSVDAPELRLLRREWPDEFGSHLKELSSESNRALDACRHDWALYLQADELIHEDDLPALRRALARAEADGRAEGLLFDYLHFHGSPDWVLEGRRRYRREVRVVRRGAGVRSVRDAQGFRVGGAGGRKPRVLRAGARIFHYGYVKSREGIDRKQRLWKRWFGQEPSEDEGFTFHRYRGVRRFEGEHPAAIRPWLEGRSWPFEPDEAEPPPRDLRTLKVRLSDAVERWTGHRPLEHRNWELIE